jgi:hypothetical protein
MTKPLIRPAGPQDLPGILELERQAWGEESAAMKEMVLSRIMTFPKGNLIAILNGEIVGLLCTLLIKKYELKNTFRTWYEATANGQIAGLHNPEGETVYGVNLSVMPSIREHNIGRMLVCHGIEHLVVGANRPMTVLGGRMNGYAKYLSAHPDTSPEKYLEMVVDGKITDPSINFFLGLEFRGVHYRAVRVLPDYFEDPDSLDNGVLLVWDNKFLH